mmetsp:Transcript_1158/g.1271  ORF Transcript_1158/g.1271 Transcript_1158/m.1271 type:complete len:84 (-) Transcript_1158:318-569(-)
MFNGIIEEEERTLEDHDRDQELKKLERFLIGNGNGEAVGSHRRLVLTRSLADLFLILFSIFDFTSLRPVYGFKTLKYLSWLCQ